MQEEKDDTKPVKKDNLWQKFLNDALVSGRGAKKEGHLVVLGSANAGKTGLVAQFKKLESQTSEMKRFLMMRYAYVNLTDANSDESRALLNIWQVSDPSHCKILDVVIPPEHMEHVCYLVCLDASEPSLVEEEYTKWMTALQETQKRLLSRLSAQQQGKLMDKLTNHIQFYQNPNDAEAEPFNEDEKENVEMKTENLEINLGCPIIIVATKCDMFRKHYIAESEADDHFEILLSYIRWWSLKYGISTFTMARGLKDQARRILSYIDHRLFDTTFIRGPNAVVKLSNLQESFLFIPAGFDTKNTITSQFPDRSLEDPIIQYFNKKKTNEKEDTEKIHLRAQEDSIFLKTLAFELERADNSGNNPSGNSGGASNLANGQSNANGAAKTGDNTAVQRFFNTLLTKDTVQTGGQN